MSISYPANDQLSTRPHRLRALVEINDGELVVFPIASTDEEARQITEALRFVRVEFDDR